MFVLTRQDGKTAIRRRGDSGLLAGLWEFPHAEGELPETLAAQQLSAWGLRVRGWRRTLRAAHQFTHRRWEMTGYLLDVEGDGEPDWLWADEVAMEAKAIPSAWNPVTVVPSSSETCPIDIGWGRQATNLPSPDAGSRHTSPSIPTPPNATRRRPGFGGVVGRAWSR